MMLLDFCFCSTVVLFLDCGLLFILFESHCCPLYSHTQGTCCCRPTLRHVVIRGWTSEYNSTTDACRSSAWDLSVHMWTVAVAVAVKTGEDVLTVVTLMVPCATLAVVLLYCGDAAPWWCCGRGPVEVPVVVFNEKPEEQEIEIVAISPFGGESVRMINSQFCIYLYIYLMFLLSVVTLDGSRHLYMYLSLYLFLHLFL
jgi:hypothetical protein